MTDRWFFPGTPVSSTNKTDRHEITKICCVESDLKPYTPPTTTEKDDNHLWGEGEEEWVYYF